MAAACGAREAAAPDTPTIIITNAWAAPTPPGVNVGAGYLTITNAQAADDTLIGVVSSRAGRAEIHEMAMDGAVMRMRPVQSLPIAPEVAAVLAPGGRHLMFYDLTAPFVAGETIDVTLRFANAGDIDVSLPVRARHIGHGGH